MPTRPSIMSGSLDVEIDITPPEAPDSGSGLADAAVFASGPLGQALGYAVNPVLRNALGPAFRQENIVGSYLSQPDLSGRTDPDFDLLKRVEEEGKLNDFNYFLTVRNEDDFQLKLERLNREIEDRRILDESGFAGFQTSLAAGVLDVTSLLPGGAIGAGGRAINAVRVGAAAGGAAAIAEAGLHANQARRTNTETLFAIGGSVFLGAGIGAVVGKRTTREVWNRLARQIEDLPQELEAVNRDLSAKAVEPWEVDYTDRRFELRNEGRLQFLRKFPGGYLADVAKKYGKEGLAVVLEKFSPLAPLTRLDPLARSQLQTSAVGRQVVADLAETVLQYRINEQGAVISPGGSVEQVAKYRTHQLLLENIWALQKGYAAHKADGPVGTLGTLVAPLSARVQRLSGGEKLTPKQFFEEVGTALFSKDQHEVKAVRDLAATLRGRVLEPIRKELVEVGFFDDLPYKPKFGESYAPRRYKLEEIRKNERNVFEALRDEFRKTQTEAQMRIADAEKPDVDPPDGSDFHVAAMTSQDIDDAVTGTINAIKGLKPGQSFIDVMQTSPLKGRVLDVDDKVLLDLGILETDAATLIESYVRQTIPRIEMMRKFGSLDMRDQLQAVRNDYSRMREDTTSPSRILQLENEEAARITDLEGMRDRILGIYDMPANPRDVWGRAGTAMKNITYMQLLGMQVAAAMPDVAGIISRGSVGEFSRAMLEMSTNMPKFAKNTKEAAELLEAFEWVGNSRARKLAELDTLHMNQSWAERALEGGTGAFSHATGMTAWNTVMKSLANVIVMSKLLKAADAVVKGKATKAQKIALAENNIDEALARRISQQFEKHGEKGNALWFAQASKWSDDGAFRAGQMAVNREADIGIITPGQDKPLWFSKRVGSVFFQLKTFGVSANHRILLSGIQRGNADVLLQFAAMFALGAVVSNLRADLSGRPRKEGQDLVIDAIDRSGIFQTIFEANAVAEIGGFGIAGLTGSQLPSRFQGRSQFLGAMGPNVDMVKTALEVTNSIRADKPMSPADIDKFARLLPWLHNSPYALVFRNDIREGLAGILGEDYDR